MRALEQVKLATMNAFAWIGSIVSINTALPYLQAIGLLFSMVVSAASLVLIYKRINAIDKDKE